MKTKPVYVYWCKTEIPGVGLMATQSRTKLDAVRRRRSDFANGFPCGPIVRVDVPLPPAKGGEKR